MTVRLRCTPSMLPNQNSKWGWLKSYDPEAHGGRGVAKFTADIDEAMTFPDNKAAWDCYRQIPKNRPTRADGKPNRPLMAYTVLIDPS